MTEKNHTPGESHENTSFASVQSAIHAVLDTIAASARTFLRLLLIPGRTMPSLLDGGQQFVPSLAFLALASFIFLTTAEAVAQNIARPALGPDIFIGGLLSLKDSSAFDLVLRALPVFLTGVAVAALARQALARPAGQERMGRAFHYATGVQLVTVSLLTLLIFSYAPIHDVYGVDGDQFVHRINRNVVKLLFDKNGLLYLLAFALAFVPARALWRAAPPPLLRRATRHPAGRLVALPAACLLSFALALAAVILPLAVGRWVGGEAGARVSFAAPDNDVGESASIGPPAKILSSGSKSEITFWAVVRNNTGAPIYLSRAHAELWWRPDVSRADYHATKMPVRIEKWSDGDSPLLAVKPGEVKWLAARADPGSQDVEWMKRAGGREEDKLYRLRLVHFYPDRNNYRDELSTGWTALRLKDGTAEAAPTASPGGR